MAFGYTRTLPTITGSHSDFPVLLTTGSFPTEAIDGGSTSILNGGGNLRAYTDDTKTTQLPVEIVIFVTGVTPEIHVWVKIPTAATGNTIYIEADDTETTQPPVTDPFGRNAVWTNEDLAHHLIDNSATQVDSSGNDDGSLIGTALTASNTVRPPSNIDFNESSYVGNIIDPSIGSTRMAVRCWYKTPVLNFSKAISGSWRDNADMSYLLLTAFDDFPRFRVDTVSSPAEVIGTTKVQDNTFHHIAGFYNGSSIQILVDGVLEDTASLTGAINNPATADFEIGRYGQEDSRRPRDLQLHRVSTSPNISANYIKTEYENQNDPDNWGTSSPWEDQAGVTAATSGTAVPTQTEVQVVNGGETIILTLTGDTWVAAGATFDAVRQDIIDGLNSAQSELTGWNNEVRDKEVVTAVVRTSDTVVTITLSASPLYDITATETITATVPASALLDSTSPIVSSPTFTVTSVSPTIAIPVIINANQLIGG